MLVLPPDPPAPNLSAYVTTTALDTALDDYTSTSDLPTYSTFFSTDAGLVPSSGGTSTTKFLSQVGTFITLPEPTAPNLSAYVQTTELNTALEDYATTSDLPSTTTAVTQSSTDLVSTGAVYTAINTALEDYSQGAGISINSQDKIDLKTNGSSRLRIKNDGKVGIGTTAPVTALTIDSAGAISGNYKSHSLIIDQTAYNQTRNGGGILFGGLKSSTENAYWAKLSGEKANLSEDDADGVLRLWTRSGSSQQERMIIDNDGNVGMGITDPTEALEVNGKIKCEDVKFPIPGAGGVVSDQSLVSLHSAVSSLRTSLSDYAALSSALSDYVLSSDLPTTTIPQADADTLGGVKIDGNNLSINSSTGILSAQIVLKQSVTHVGVFTLQDDTNLRTEQGTLLRWKPSLR
jgi:hypothetical protein